MKKRHRFRGKWFKVVEKRLPLCVDGLCHFEDRLIEIDPSQEDRERLETLIHEALHACIQDLSEDAVEATGYSISNLLWADGWRK